MELRHEIRIPTLDECVDLMDSVVNNKSGLLWRTRGPLVRTRPGRRARPATARGAGL